MKVGELSYAPREFRATVSCNEKSCEVGVYPGKSWIPIHSTEL